MNGFIKKTIILICLFCLLSNFSFFAVGIKDNKKALNPTVLNNGPMDSAWPMKCHDVRHTSQSPYSTENNPLVEIWRFRSEHSLGGQIDGSPVIDEDGNIYIGTMGTDRKVYCLYPNGTKKWSYQFDGLVWSTPALGEDGTVYVTCWDAGVYALYPNGTRKWRFGAGDSIGDSPAIAEDGTIYFGTMGNNIFAVNPDGTEKWQYSTGNYIASDPAIGEDGTVYIGSADSYLYAMNPNGTLKWRFDTGGYIKCSPSISDDGVIYINSWDNYLYAIYPDGTLKWKTNVGWGMSGSASIAEDGTIYFFTETLDAYYPNNGTLKWRLDVGGNGGRASPAISADGTIYVCNHEGRCIIAVSPGGEEIWRKQLSNYLAVSSPAIAEDGTIHVGSSWGDEGGYHHGYLHAFGEGEQKKIELTYPEPDFLYIFGKKIVQSKRNNTIIFGNCDVKVDSYSTDEITEVNFYVDGSLIHTDYESPYECILDEKYGYYFISQHTLTVEANFEGGCSWSEYLEFWHVHL